LKAIRYIRISTKDQSNFSIEGQVKATEHFCMVNKYEVINTYIDDGKSAKNFDRPDWKKLEEFVKNNQVDYLVVMKYDRFSRNLLEALQKIELLETKYKIRILSVMEPIAVHPQSPYYFKMRADILTGAQTEWLIIRDRTKFGINVAQKNGRYLNRAPFGYVNKKDSYGKPIIVLDELRSPIVRGMFNMYLQGETPYKIRIWAKEQGFELKGKSAITRILKNYTYAGLVRVTKYYDDKEHFTKGMHEPIISEETFNRVQNILNYSERGQRTIITDNAPLRAVLKCYCARPLTAAPSKGKSKWYWYYKCNTHYQVNLNAEKLNAQMEEIFDNLSLPDNYVKYIKSKVQSILKDADINSVGRIAETEKLIDRAKKDIKSLELKYLRNEFEYDAYFKWKTNLNQELYNLENQLVDLKRIPASKYDIDSLANMGYVYRKADTPSKQALVNTVFNKSLYYFEGSYRTPYLFDLFESKALILKEKGLLEYEQPLDDLGNLPVRSPYGASIEHWNTLFEIIAEIQNAA
jgi:site-specific DNA recombinase